MEIDSSEVEAALKRLSNNARALDGQKASFGELFDAPFMLTHTQYNSFEQFIAAGGFQVESAEEWNEIPAEAFDQHVAAHTEFASWDEMLSAAGAEWAARRLGL